MAIYPEIKEVKKDVIELLSHAIAHSKVTESTPKNYIERRDLEAKVQLTENAVISGAYWIVYGRKIRGGQSQCDQQRGCCQINGLPPTPRMILYLLSR